MAKQRPGWGSFLGTPHPAHRSLPLMMTHLESELRSPRTPQGGGIRTAQLPTLEPDPDLPHWFTGLNLVPAGAT